MYQIWGIENSFKVIAFLGVIALLLLQQFFPESNFLRFISVPVTLAMGLVVILGQTKAFPWLCKKFPQFLPNIDGNWDAELRSNWPQISQRISGEPSINSAAPVKAKVKIIVRLFFIKILLESDTKYSESKTLAVTIRKNKEDGSIKLYYVYENDTLTPEVTDSNRHFGAAYLKMQQKEGGDISFEGWYWTNRNWEKALNTAGTIKLERPNPNNK